MGMAQLLSLVLPRLDLRLPPPVPIPPTFCMYCSYFYLLLFSVDFILFGQY
eukprot:NODE_8386_length_222_cov_23.069364_g8303_i0.p3 GENE.NODE_8386_length_222_cov_23.069364_g8303_i0~~NODE_8386_length_222_cov_23.069364_g8303_i0.p3  ORF type:complete len:61 (+),score=18.44 NODE_8386_length_222_cov_23.069364_g8303_i0:33-185(+)